MRAHWDEEPIFDERHVAGPFALVRERARDAGLDALTVRASELEQAFDFGAVRGLPTCRPAALRGARRGLGRGPRSAGGRPVPASSEAGRVGLSAAELRVARMAAEGMSNAEIAQQLWIVPKTVEWHFGRVYGKLGVRSRAELPAALQRTREEKRLA